MTTKDYIFERLHSGPLFKRNERDYSMFFLSSFGDAHTIANQKYTDDAITLAFMVFKNSISSYYRLAEDDETLQEKIVKNIVDNPSLKDEIFRDYSDAGERLWELYKQIETQDDFDIEFIEELSKQLHKILIGQICILHRSDSFIKHFSAIPGLSDEIAELRKKYESAFGLFETNLEKLFQKILKKVDGATVQDFKLLTPTELIKSIEEGKLPIEKVKERKNLAIMNYLPQVEIIAGELAEEIYIEIKANEEKYNPTQNDNKEVKGQTVFGTGKISGVCRLITDYDKVESLEEGVILITPSTLPKYNDIYTRAKAIVTNEGGVLAHASILCREFKIPGIVGTKIATQVFIDGMNIELDLDKGIVKKI